MTASKQDLEIEGLIAGLNTYLQDNGFGPFEFNHGFEVGAQVKPMTMALHFLPNGPEPFQMGNSDQKYYRRVLQIDTYMDTRGRALAVNDLLMDYLDLTAVSIVDPLAGNAIVGSIACYDTDSIYSEIAPPNLTNPKVIRWRAITRATLDAFYPRG